MEKEDILQVVQVLGRMDRGGAETMVMNLYRQVDKSKIQFVFVVHTNDRCSYDEEIENLGGIIYHVPRYNGKNHFVYKKWWENFFAGHPQYKILHSHIRSTASIYLPIAKKNGVATIVHSHSTSNGSGFAALVKKMMQYPIRYEADYFFGCSQIGGEWLFGKKIVKSDRYYILQNAINIEDYDLNSDIRNKVREQFGIEKKLVFGHVGRLHEAKNHMFLLELFAVISEDNPNSILLIIGDGELRGQIEKKIKERHLEDKVLMLGARSDVPELLFAMDVFLFPSKWEGLPISVVEAQAAGLPCFISDKVTKEVGVSELVHYLSIDQGYQIWMKELQAADLRRKNVKNSIKKAGFDIKETSNWLTLFYQEIMLH